jgi:hydroxymethylglutaryl-CoA reductase (NADPH)
MSDPTAVKGHGRRTLPRVSFVFDLKVTFRNHNGNYHVLSGATTTIGEAGVSCKLEHPLPSGVKHVKFELVGHGHTINHTGQVAWVSETRDECGIKFDKGIASWSEIYNKLTDLSQALLDRRSNQRRSSENSVSEDKRKQGRRYADLLDDFSAEEDLVQNLKVKTFLRSKSTTHTEETITGRREWVGQLTNTPLKHLASFSEDYSQFKNKIENPIGVAHTPLGIAGPLRINGDHARGIFFIPLATTEGALVTSYTLGAHIVTRSGGADVCLLKDELRIGPMLVFKTQREARAFVTWVRQNFVKLKQLTESTSHHLKLTKTSTILNGRRVILNFHYETGDAMGMNMGCKATEFVCQFITAAIKPEEFWLRSNFNSNKKVTGNNFINGYGKTVTADVTIPRKLISMLNTTPEDMERYFARTLFADAHALQVGANGHFANAIAAIYIACGQDVGLVANSHVGISTCEVTKAGDLYFSAHLTNILCGTVGGGTSFGTAKECLAMLDCVGSGKAKKFAEIIAATALAGEIGICASIVNGTYVFAHETFGRNKPIE